jgi:hypothetical protein
MGPYTLATPAPLCPRLNAPPPPELLRPNSPMVARQIAVSVDLLGANEHRPELRDIETHPWSSFLA